MHKTWKYYITSSLGLPFPFGPQGFIPILPYLICTVINKLHNVTCCYLIFLHMILFTQYVCYLSATPNVRNNGSYHIYFSVEDPILVCKCTTDFFLNKNKFYPENWVDSSRVLTPWLLHNGN